MGGSLSIGRTRKVKALGTRSNGVHAVGVSSSNKAEYPPSGLEKSEGALLKLPQRLDEAERALDQIAQEAEGRRERVFRDNENVRERIFLDNEERRDLEARQRGDALFHELEDRIANLPPISIPPFQEEDRASESARGSEGDTAGRRPRPPHRSPATTVPPFSLVPPTIIRIPGRRSHSPDSHERILSAARYPPMPSERGTHRRRPSFEMEDAPDHPHRHPSSARGDARRSPKPTTTPSHPEITERDGGRPPSEMIPHVPPPGQSRPQLPSGLENFEDALRERQQRPDDAERALDQIAQIAQDAEDGREGEFRDNQDGRKRIFFDNEERRELETRERGDTLFNELEDRFANIPVPPPPRNIETESIIGSMRDTAARYSEILDTVRLEREEMAREREALAAERAHERAVLDEARGLLDEEREVRIAALEEELARTRGELDNERQLRMTEANEVQMAAAERHEALHNQLADLTNLLVYEQESARQREEERRQASEGKLGIDQVMQELLQRQNTEQKDLFSTLSEGWRSDNNRQHQETIDAIRATANDQVPFNVQGYLEEFSRAAVSEIRMLLGEVGKLREEHRSIQ